MRAFLPLINLVGLYLSASLFTQSAFANSAPCDEFNWGRLYENKVESVIVRSDRRVEVTLFSKRDQKRREYAIDIGSNRGRQELALIQSAGLSGKLIDFSQVKDYCIEGVRRMSDITIHY